MIDRLKANIIPIEKDSQMMILFLNNCQKTYKITKKLISIYSKVLIQMPFIAENGSCSIWYKMLFVKLISQFRNLPRGCIIIEYGMIKKAIPAYIMNAIGNTMSRLLSRK